MNKIDFTFEQLDNVGIFNLSGELKKEHEDELKLLLMKAIHSTDRAVLNMKLVSGINYTCLELLRKAYCTSVRLRKPIILTEVPENYIKKLFNCENAKSLYAGWIEEFSSSSA